MTTRELIKALRDVESVELAYQAADKLELLMNQIDDLTNHHYVDTFDFYFNRCEELEEQLDAATEDIEKAIDSDDLCSFCAYEHNCEGTKCPHYLEGVGMYDMDTGERFDRKWTCMDFDYGTCPMLENTPCNGCFESVDRNFTWKGYK